jgi:hypothetical protein
VVAVFLDRPFGMSDDAEVGPRVLVLADPD